MEKFIVCIKRNGLFQFKLIDEEGRMLLTSLSYVKKEDCLHDLDFLRLHFDFTNSSGVTQINHTGYCFVLYKSETDLLAISKEFKTGEACNDCIRQLRLNAAAIAVDERLH